MIARFLEPRTEAAYALLRLVAGTLFAFHGAQKLFGVFAGQQPPFGTQLWLGGVIELVTGTLLAIGLFTVWAGVLASGTMAVAYLQFHWKFQGGEQFFPIVNKGEPALLNAVVFLFLACRGGGPFSLDALLARRRGGRAPGEPA